MAYHCSTELGKSPELFWNQVLHRVQCPSGNICPKKMVKRDFWHMSISVEWSRLTTPNNDVWYKGTFFPNLFYCDILTRSFFCLIAKDHHLGCCCADLWLCCLSVSPAVYSHSLKLAHSLSLPFNIIWRLLWVNEGRSFVIKMCDFFFGLTPWI